MPAIGNAAPRRGRRSPRQDAIMQIGRKARGQTQNGPGGMLGDRSLGGPSRGRVQVKGRVGRAAAVAGAGGKAPLGNQLQRRVKVGAIDASQAQRTAGQRQTLAAAYGKDFRRLLGGPGAFNKLRQQLAKNPDNPKLQQRNQALMQKRSQLLTAARERLGAGTGTGRNPAPGGGQPGRVNPAGRGLLNPPGQGPARRPRRRRVAPARSAY